MIKIRKHVFETNSSSSHSFSMGPEGRFNSRLDIINNGVIEISSDCWAGIRRSNDPEVKLSYLLSFADTISYENKSKWGKYRDFIYQVVKDFTGATEIKFEPTEIVDHQSTDIIDERDLLNPEFIKEFVFNEDTWLYLLWDSESPDKDFFKDYEFKDKDLYKVTFNLPGIDKKDSELILSYRDTDYLGSVLYDFLDDFVYNQKTGLFCKESECENGGMYAGNFKYYIENTYDKFISIDTPKIEIL